MFRMIGLLGISSLCCLAGNNPVREMTSQATRVGGQLVPAFYKGYVYWIGHDGNDREVNIYGPDGYPAFVFVSENGLARNLAFDGDSTLAVAWWGPNKTGGIDFRDRYGQVTKTIQTGRFLPAHIAFDEDHSLWVFGWQVDAIHGDRADRQDYMTVRKYLPDGKQAGAYLPRSLFPAGLDPAIQGWQERSIFIAHDRVGIWAVSGDSSGKTEWVELDLSGKLLSRTRLDEFGGPIGIALTRDGHLYIQSHFGNPKEHQLYALDRDSRAWRLVEDPPTGYLVGADENTLEFEDVALGPVRLRWYEPPTPAENSAAVLLK
jgi:hypothetical protein